MTNKTIKKLIKNINNSNKAYEAMEPRDKRVTIARDVIKQLEGKKFVAKHQVYIGSSLRPYHSINYLFGDGSFQETLKKIPSCNVCAKGALLACTVARQNEVQNEELVPENFTNSSKLSEMLGGVFSKEQLRLIETEFENEDIEYSINAHRDEEMLKAGPIPCIMRLHFKYDNAEDRMIAIMKNIIRNRGTFRPDKEA